MVRICLTVATALACGCHRVEVEPAEFTSTAEQCTSVEGESRSCGTQLYLTQGFDFLFVVDRSARMGPAQAKLARAMPELVEALAELPHGLSARVAFVPAEAPLTTCPGVTAPELTLQSCREHLDDFVRKDGTDARASACTDVCTLDALTTTSGPWIEWDEKGSNLEGVDIAAALACAAPQGIAGCDFPAPIGAVEHAIYELARTNLVITVIVSDAADCSITGDDERIFDPDGQRTFWSDPTATEPMPAICWNAGVTCTSDYDACEIAYKDAHGDAPRSDHVLAGAEAVLDIQGEVVGIVGVPEGWQHGDAVPYAEADDPAVQREYGIGPACTASDGSFALPSPRLQAFVEANPNESDATDLFSMCADDWGPTMYAIVGLAREMIRPNCLLECVADVDGAEGLQTDCEMTLAHTVDGETVEEPFPRCGADGAVPAGALGCWSPLTGAARTPICRNAGWNLELELHWADTFPDGAAIVPDCRLSEFPAGDCAPIP